MEQGKEELLETIRAAKWQEVPALVRDAAEGLKGDREVVLAAVKQNGYALEYAAEELKEDREVALVAVTQDGDALEYGAEGLIVNPSKPVGATPLGVGYETAHNAAPARAKKKKLGSTSPVRGSSLEFYIEANTT